MFGHNNTCDHSSEFLDHYPLADITTLTPPPLLPCPSTHGDENDAVPELRSELGYIGSGCSSSMTSYVQIQYSPTLFQRNISSHSILKHSDVHNPTNTSPAKFFVPTVTSSVRKTSSTRDVQGVNIAQRNQRSNSPLSNDQNGVMECMNRACKYSPEEKKERIERYRSKRNLRNFNKKIKYECRKTLADSRPRVRGRFARNDETENTPQRWDNIYAEEDDEGDDNWINFLDSFQQNLIPQC